MIKITGNTYPVRDTLSRLGGQWVAEGKYWQLPDEAEAEVRKITVPVGGHEQLWERCERCGREPVDGSHLCKVCRGSRPLTVERVGGKK